MFDSEGGNVTRGEFIGVVVDIFDLRKTKTTYIDNCDEHREFCFYNFLAMSSYDDIQLDPELVLYPDIPVTHKYYDEVTVGTMLGLINGYVGDENSPFRPESSISRIQALKIILGAAEAVVPKYRFEMIDILGSLDQLSSQFSSFSDIDAKISYMWWYPRYVNFAVENDIVNGGNLFRPDETITKKELDDMIVRTQKYIRSQNEKADASGDSELEANAGGGKEEGT